MTVPSPLQECIANYELTWSKPDDAENRTGAATGQMEETFLCEFLPWGEGGCSVLATTGSVELEYAAIRKSVGMFDASCRGIISLEGEDRLAFIDRMTTQLLTDIHDGDALLAFILNRKGRIIADVIVVCEKDRILVDCDVTVVSAIIDHFKLFIVADDVKITNATQQEHRIWLIGPLAKELDEFGTTFTLPKQFLGVEGTALTISPEDAEVFWQKIVDKSIRPVGWYALNMARVEEGTPLFRVDYDNENLPHETSSCHSRVKFDKGCYLGQEVVARMESLGRPKQLLVHLELSNDELPTAGTQIWDSMTDGGGKAIGVVTSSAISPMKGGVVSVIAMVKNSCSADGTEVFPLIGEEQMKAVVRPLLPKEEVE